MQQVDIVTLLISVMVFPCFISGVIVPTWAMPPTNFVLTTTSSSSAFPNAAFWAALTRLSDARLTAFPAAFEKGKKFSNKENA